MSEQEQEKDHPPPVDKRSSTGGKLHGEHHEATPAGGVESLSDRAKEAKKREEDALRLGLEAQLEEEKKKAETYLANWQRAAADFQNYKRRTDQEREELGRLANAALVINILPILDDLERALTSVDTRLAGLTWIDGIRLIYRKFQAVLEASGVREIKAEGEDFDPRYHEAVMYGEGEEGKVISEVQKGYMLGDRVIRPSAVVIGRGPKEQEQKQEGEDREQ